MGTGGPRRRHDHAKISRKSAFLVRGGYEVIHPDSRVDLGSSHHFMHNGEEINLVSAMVDEKSTCRVHVPPTVGVPFLPTPTYMVPASPRASLSSLPRFLRRAMEQ